MTAIQTYAADINRHHEQAQQLAASAIDHAKMAGALLLQAKEQLPHGEFLPWLEAHCAVSPRQAQRYMRAALGKPALPRQALAIEGPGDVVASNDATQPIVAVSDGATPPEECEASTPKNDTVTHLAVPARQQKEARILDLLKAGESMTRFDAERHGDHCLNSTIAKLRAKGHNILSTWERVPGRFSDDVRCLRYFYGGAAACPAPQMDLIDAAEQRG